MDSLDKAINKVDLNFLPPKSQEIIKKAPLDQKIEEIGKILTEMEDHDIDGKLEYINIKLQLMESEEEKSSKEAQEKADESLDYRVTRDLISTLNNQLIGKEQKFTQLVSKINDTKSLAKQELVSIANLKKGAGAVTNLKQISRHKNTHKALMRDLENLRIDKSYLEKEIFNLNRSLKESKEKLKKLKSPDERMETAYKTSQTANKAVRVLTVQKRNLEKVKDKHDTLLHLKEELERFEEDDEQQYIREFNQVARDFDEPSRFKRKIPKKDAFIDWETSSEETSDLNQSDSSSLTPTSSSSSLEDTGTSTDEYAGTVFEKAVLMRAMQKQVDKIQSKLDDPNLPQEESDALLLEMTTVLKEMDELENE